MSTLHRHRRLKVSHLFNLLPDVVPDGSISGAAPNGGAYRSVHDGELAAVGKVLEFCSLGFELKQPLEDFVAELACCLDNKLSKPLAPSGKLRRWREL